MKMKKIIALMLCCMMILSLAGCQLPLPRRANPATATDSEEATEEKTTGDTEEETEEETEEPTTEEAKSTGNTGDIADAVAFGSTSEENTVPLGQWCEFTRYATEDKMYHTIYVRVVGVVTATDDAAYIDECIAAHNEVAYDFQQIDLSEITIPSDVEACIMEYEVYVPADFPAPEYGMVEPTLSLRASNITGGGIPSADGASTYIGMGSMEDLENDIEKFEPGNTYTFKGLFFMVKGFEDYLFEDYSYADGTSEGDLVHCYWASH